MESDEDDTGSDEGSDSAREECEGSASGIYQFIFHCLIVNSSSSYLAWFKRPRSMPLWLYKYFATTITPLINRKDGRHLMKPLLFSDDRPYTPPTFWINPPEPTISLSLHQFDPTLLWRPQIFIWLPHFFVKELLCPTCGDILQKNGAAHPRRITDINDNFYAITRPTKRRRVVPAGERKHPNVRTCRRCKEPDCPGSNDITKCLAVCTVACRTCKQFKGCRGVDNGQNCTFVRR